MEGFKTVFSDDTSCIVLYFSSWTLESKIKFSWALWGISTLAFCTEALTCARREGVSSVFMKFGCSVGNCCPPNEVMTAVKFSESYHAQKH
jgi:hypothetical protein